MNQTSTTAPLIQANGLTKHYDGFSLAGVSVTVEPGQVVGFVGKNGSGKSTTIKALLGLISLDGGQASVLGYSPRDLANTSSSKAKEQVGVVFDTISLPGHLKIAEVGKAMGRAYATWDAAAFARRLRASELDSKKAVKDLSRGMGMKLSLACALSHNPRLLILDEATAGLDPMARDEVLDVLRDFVAVEDAQGNPVNGILMSSHITSDLDKIADTVLCIDSGRPVFNVAKDEVCDLMGIARCRAAELEQIARSGIIAPGAMRILRQTYGIDLLVPDRFAFAENFPSIPCDRMGIDEYMVLMIKGEHYC